MGESETKGMRKGNRERQALLCLLAVVALARAAAASITAEERRLLTPLRGEQMMPWVHRLCRPEFAGRKAGTEGAARAAQALANHFRRLGLEELDGAPGFKQPFTMKFSLLRSRWDRRATLVNSTGGTPLQVVYAEFPARECALRGDAIFIGYGIHRPDRQWDDYDGVNLQNRIVVFWNGQPPGVSQSIQARCRAAQARGAIGCLVIIGGGKGAGEMEDRGVGRLLSDFPVIQLRRQTAARLFGRPVPRPTATTLVARAPRKPIPPRERPTSDGECHGAKRLTHEGDGEPSGGRGLSTPRPLRSTAGPAGSRGSGAGSARLGRISIYIPPSVDPTRPLENVLGAWRGSDPVLRDEWILFSAHLDHLGQEGRATFFGADDDASGVAVVCAVAEAFRRLRTRPRRSILFALWNGEECGLLGSRHFVNESLIPLEQIVGMLQLDMVGVGRPDAFLTSPRRPPAPLFRFFEEAAQALGLSLPHDEVRGVSDHIPFQRSGIPAMVATTAGAHPDYHTVGDRPEKVLPAALENCARLSALTLWRLANDLGGSRAARRPRERGRQASRKSAPDRPTWVASRLYAGAR